MRSPLFLLAGLLSLCLVATPAVGQDAAELLTNDDIVRLSKAGLPASVIVAKITSSRTDFDTSVDALVALSEAEVDAKVLEAMTNAGAPAAPTADVPTAGTLERCDRYASVAGRERGLELRGNALRRPWHLPLRGELDG